MQAHPQKIFIGLNPDCWWTESDAPWIYTKVFQLASLTLSHATLLHQHRGLFTMYEHHTLALTFLSFPCIKLPRTAGKSKTKAIQGLKQPWPSWMWRRILFVEVSALHRVLRNLERPEEVLNELVLLPEKPRYSSMALGVKQAVGNLSGMCLCQ